mgnify:CR=1 FL=1
MQILQDRTQSATQEAIDSNFKLFDHSYVFGMQGRMIPVLYPLSCLIKNKSEARVLIIGPRTEDDIFLAKSLGITNCIGLDLITYSPHIILGDMHNIPFGDDEFDAVVFGWSIAYSSDPQLASSEALRITKHGGLIGIGWEWILPTEKLKDFNRVNTAADHLDLFKTNKTL